MSNILHMQTDDVQSFAKTLLAFVDNLNQVLTRVNASITDMDWQSSSRRDFDTNFQDIKLRFDLLAQEGTSLSNRINREIDEWENTASLFSDSASQNGTLTLGFQNGVINNLNKNSWHVVLGNTGKPIIEFADGTKLDLSLVEAGDVNAIKSLGIFMEDRAFEMNIAKLIAEGKWVEVDGYINGQSGKWVDDYLRAFPGGKALAKNLGTAGNLIEVGNLGVSLIAALTDKKGGQWVEIPLGQVDGKPVVYSFFVPPTDHWRDSVEKAGGLIGSELGTIAGGAAGGFTSPVTGPVGPVVGGIGGSAYGDELGKNIFGTLYDSLVPHPSSPPNPHSNMIETGVIDNGNQSGIYVNTNPNADVIDLSRMVGSGNGQISTQVNYSIGQDGQPHMNVITSANF